MAISRPITLESARRDARLTQAEIAKKMGVSVSAVSRWEKGVSDMSARQFALFCEIVDRSRDDISLPNELHLTQ